MKKLTLILIISLFITNCSKDNEEINDVIEPLAIYHYTNICFYVKEIDTNIPVSGAIVYVSTPTFGLSGGQSTYSGISDENGEAWIYYPTTIDPNTGNRVRSSMGTLSCYADGYQSKYMDCMMAPCENIFLEPNN